jgi:hypothetical protein
MNILVTLFRITELVLKILKFGFYVFLAILVYGNFIGSEQFGYLLGVKEASEKGIEMGAIILSKQLVFVTLILAILEAFSNLISFFKPVLD